jgi:hypothetical protein
MSQHTWRAVIAALLGAVALAACTGAEATPAAPAEVPVVVANVTTVAEESAPEGESPAGSAPAATTGMISGRLTFPSEGIPPMAVFAVRTDGMAHYSVNTQRDQQDYSLEVPPGDYYVMGYLDDGGPVNMAGSYSQLTLCEAPGGSGATCDDHRLAAVTVAAGATATGIDVTDWYGPPGSIPPRPVAAQAGSGSSPAPASGSTTGSDTAVDAAPGDPGTISGGILYPSEGHPAVSVYALRTDGQRWQYTNVLSNAGNYALQMPPGDYHVVGYVLGAGGAVELAGGYTGGGSSLATVTVESGKTVSGIDLDDWGPAGDYTALPGR